MPTEQELLDRIAELEAKVERLAKPLPKKRPLFGGKREPTVIIDTKTKVVYHSKSAAGKALAEEANTVPTDNFAWYKLTSKFPQRLRGATEMEVKKAKATGAYFQLE